MTPRLQVLLQSVGDADPGGFGLLYAAFFVVGSVMLVGYALKKKRPDEDDQSS